MNYSRKLSPKFLTDLQSGILLPLLKRVKEDQTLMLAIRDNYINIYYRGGSLFEISPRRDGVTYVAKFDSNFNKQGTQLPTEFPVRLINVEQVSALVGAMPELKYRMDDFFAKSGKSEREFQQLVVRENNFSNDTHYFIVDIEIAGILPGARFDMLAVRWLSHERGRPGTLVPALIEMKYGVSALKGSASLKKHLDDARALIAKTDEWCILLNVLEEQLNQLNELELLTLKKNGGRERLKIDRYTKPELIFLLAGYNPGSRQLAEILNDQVITGQESIGFDLLFFAAAFAGYAMYRESMLELKEFNNEVSRLFKLANSTRKGKRELAPAAKHD